MKLRRAEQAAVDPSVTVAVLSAAIPYIRRFSGKVVVVKYGGNALAGTEPGGEGALEEALASFASDIVLMHSVGVLPVVVHGGGPQISELMARLGKTPEFRSGLRVTDAETLDIARMVLVGRVNRDIVGAINVFAPLAVGLTGEDAGLIAASASDPELGFAGDVRRVQPAILHRLLNEGLVPVIATIGSDEHGQAYNINADTVAGAIAAALAAEKLIFLTDVDGIRADPAEQQSTLARLDVDALDELLAGGAVEGGMIPKVRACSDALRNGVGSAHVLDGRVPHAALLELFTDEGIGTMITRGKEESS